MLLNLLKLKRKVTFPFPSQLSFFKVLGISEKENLHSKFLAFLLNPKSLYHCGQVFLKMFIDLLQSKLDKNSNVSIDKNFECKRIIRETGSKKDKKNKSGGRIDIGILNKNSENHIIIENKLYAIDQPEQLLRYKHDYPNAVIVYLTLTGKSASSNSLGNEITENDYIKLSYKDDILIWLYNCKKYIEELNDTFLTKETNKQILFLINNYIIIVNELTKIAKENELILPVFSKNIDYLTYFFNKHDEIKKIENANIDDKKIYLNKVIPLKVYLIKEFFIKKYLNKLAESIGNGLKWKLNEGKSIMQKGWGFQFYKEKWEKPNIKIGFEFNTKNLENCFCGLRKYAPKNPVIPKYYSKTGNNSLWYEKNRNILLSKVYNKRGDYIHWTRETFYQLVSDDIENTDFYKHLLSIIQNLCNKIENEIITN